MSRITYVRTAIFRDPDWLALGPDARHLWLWAILTDHSNYAGLFRCAEAHMELETGLSERRLKTALEELGAAGKVVYRGGYIWVVDKAQWASPRTEQTAKSAAAAVSECTDDELRLAFCSRYADDVWISSYLPEPASEGEIFDGHPMVADLPTLHSSFNSKTTDEKRNGKSPSRSVAREAKLPPELRPYLAPVLAALCELAAAHSGAKRPTAAAVSRVLRDYPHRDHLPAARNCAAYFVDGNGSRRGLKDPVMAYRRWLDREPDVIRRQPLAATGTDSYSAYDRPEN
ncbi:MAG: hypothetical protein ACRD2Z_03215 [Thermoanaerobaculia bacterium]